MKYWIKLKQFLGKYWKNESLFLGLLILFGAWLRLDGLTASPTDWHAFRQADTASVTREYVKHGVNLLVPKYQDLSNIQSGLDNLDGYRMVEFPIINAVEAIIIRLIPFADLVIVSRLTSLAFALAALLCIYQIGKQWINRQVGTWAALVFAILPYSRFYSRAILPEAPLLFFSTLSIWAFEEWLQKRQVKDYLLSLVALMIAALLKPFVLFWLLLYGWMALQKYQKNIWKQWPEMVFVMLSVLPLAAWRWWILQFPSGIPDNKALLNGDGIRFRPAWFRWLFWERLTKLILGGVGIIYFFIGLVPQGKNWTRIWAWGLGSLIYLSVIATGNVRHDYYQVMLLPFISITAGYGLYQLFNWLKPRIKWEGALVVNMALLVLTSAIAWEYVGGYYGTRPDYEVAGRAADQLLPADAKVIAPAFGDTIFLFQTNRTGWPIGFEIEDKIAKGAQYYITTSYDDEARELEKKYPTIAKTDQYLILDLQVLKATPEAAPKKPNL